MGLLDMFKKEASCVRCSRQVDKSEFCYCEFEVPITGQQKEQRLCRSCVEVSFQEQMENYKGRIVAVWPMKAFDAYHLYQLDEMPGMEYPPSFIAAIRRKLPAGQSCRGCGHEAKVAWFSPDLVKGNPVDFAAVSDPDDRRSRAFEERHHGHSHGMGKTVEVEPGVDETCQGEYLCASCFSKEVFIKTRETGCALGQMVFCSQGDAFFTPMEAA